LLLPDTIDDRGKDDRTSTSCRRLVSSSTPPSTVSRRLHRCADPLYRFSGHDSSSLGLSQLEERLQSAIHPDLRSRVTLEAEKELFTHTISAALLAILRELELTIDVSFAAMLKSPWKDLEFVSMESLYVADLTRDVRTVVEVVREGLEQKKYVRSTCDKIVG